MSQIGAGSDRREVSSDGVEHELSLPLDGWSDITRVAPPDRRTLVAIAIVAVAVDAALRSGTVGVGGAAVFVLTAAGLVASGRIEGGAGRAVVISGGVLGAFLAWRASGWLLAADVLAAASLIAIGSTFAPRQSDPFDVTVPRLAGRGLYVVGHAVLAPAYPLRAMGSRRVPVGVLRGAALALPLVLIVGSLLSSADAVFASFVRVPTDAGDLALHGVLLLLGGWWASTLFRAASATPFSMPSGDRRVGLGAHETTTVLTGLAGVLALFASSQAVAFVRGAEYVERTSGLSYAEYARSGFFQLLAVGFVSLATLWALRSSVESRPHVALAIAAVSGNLVIVGVALRRLFLYEAAYGLTPLRVCAVILAVWLGVVFVLTAVAVVRRPTRQWLLPASVVAAVALLTAVNLVNVEAFVVHRNVQRFAGTPKLDLLYLTSLSDDAVPALVDRLDDLTPPEREAAVRLLCDRRTSDADPSWLGANFARGRAERSISQVCGREQDR